jgi:osmotically-inducible protein OsmY
MEVSMSTIGERKQPQTIAASALALLIGWWLPQTTAHAQAPLADADIRTHVEKALLFDPAVPFDRIDVRTDDGIAMLTGSVDNLRASDRATRIVETVRGVRAVVNRIDVEPPTRYTGHRLTQRVNEALLFDPVTESSELAVTAEDDGTVTLMGLVDSWQERRLAGVVVAGVDGVTAVRNEIEVIPKADRPDHDIKPEIEGRLQWDTLIHDRMIDVAVDDGAVTLHGTVGSAAEKSRAVATAWVSGVSSVDGSTLQVESLPRDELRRRGPQLDRPDPEIRAAVVQALRYDPRVAREAIDVQVRNGVVTLTGIVDNASARSAAARDAEHTAGVIGVDNLVKLRPLPEIADTGIAERVRAALTRNPYVERRDITVRVIDSRVYLEGTVDSYFDKAEAENAAFGANGVTGVSNRLVVASPRTIVYDPFVHDWSIYDYPWYHGPVDVQRKSDLQIRREDPGPVLLEPLRRRRCDNGHGRQRHRHADRQGRGLDRACRGTRERLRGRRADRGQPAADRPHGDRVAGSSGARAPTDGDKAGKDPDRDLGMDLRSLARDLLPRWTWPDDDRLRYYAGQFESVEINNSFYQLPSAKTLAHWRDSVPGDFRFALKASRYITHMKKLKDPDASLATLFEHAAVLGDGIGPILFQMPPRWHCNEERLAAFLEALSGSFRYVFEFRDHSWMNERTDALLAAPRRGLLHLRAGRLPLAEDAHRGLRLRQAPRPSRTLPGQL